jgi:hypothetical protein
MSRGERVRLVRPLDAQLPAGSEGRVLGYLRRPEGDALAVAFDRGPTKIVEPVELEYVRVGTSARPQR